MNQLATVTQLSARWLGRAISGLATLIWALILLDILACDALIGLVNVGWEMAFLLAMVSVSLITVFIAWRNESLGGELMLMWGLVLTAIAYGTSCQHPVFSILVSGAPFVVAGFLFLVSWWAQETTLPQT